MNCSPCVALVRKAHTLCNVRQKLANRLDNREQYKRNYQGLIPLLRLLLKGKKRGRSKGDNRQLLLRIGWFAVTMKYEINKI